MQRVQLGAALALALALCVGAAADAKPNFVILFIDDLGYNEINLEEMAPPGGGYRGYGNRTSTPHLAQFAREGTVFVNWYSGWHVCSPSRAAMMTGRLPPRTGIDSVEGGVRVRLRAASLRGLPALACCRHNLHCYASPASASSLGSLGDRRS